jgi:dihydropteroate synthase
VGVYNTRLLAIRDIQGAERSIRCIGCDPGGVPIMAPKTMHHTLKLERVDSRAAVIIKQEMLSVGGDAAVCRGVVGYSSRFTDILVMGTLRQLELAIGKLRGQPFGGAQAAGEMEAVLRNLESGRDFTLRAGKWKLKLGDRTHVMGILNVTPDSFSDGGSFMLTEDAVIHGLMMAEQGADIIDIGGESTRPGAPPLSAAAEKKRVLPVIRRLAGRVKVPISIDTYKPEIADEAIDAGADIINDICGLRKKGMAELAARRDVPVIVMHMKGTPRNMQIDPEYADVVGEIHRFFRERMEFAQEKGMNPHKIVLDPGIGFGKTVGNNFEILARLREFRGLGRPILVGSSRKSFIGKVLDLPLDQRLEGGLAAAVAAVMNGASIIRAHDVLETVRAARIADSVVRSA